jgi:stage II sporulation protein D
MRTVMHFHRFIGILIIASLLAILAACSKDTNPAVPGAPENDVISVVERNPMIRVGLVSFTPQKHLFVSISRGTYKCYVGESLQSFADGIAGDILEFTGAEDTIEFTPSGSDESRELANTIVRIEPAEGVENGHIYIGTSRTDLRAYRGTIRLILEGKNLLAVNNVALEDYLLGVVPAEMNPDWPVEALRAQAAASRSYVLFNLDRYDGRGFDVADDSRSQRYGGVDVETESTTNAVIDTTNMVVKYEDKLAVVVFHYDSGGRTASNLDIWPASGEIPYLAGVEDAMGVTNFSEGSPYASWSSRASFTTLRDALNLDGKTFVGDYLSSITILGESEDGRVETIDLIGEKNPVVRAMTFIGVLNRRLDPNFTPSNLFKIRLEGNGYRFSGSGKGHGVGMSQWGAYQRALSQQGYEFILGQYFPGTEVGEIPIGGIEVVHNPRIDTIQ